MLFYGSLSEEGRVKRNKTVRKRSKDLRETDPIKLKRWRAKM